MSFFALLFWSVGLVQSEFYTHPAKTFQPRVKSIAGTRVVGNRAVRNLVETNGIPYGTQQLASVNISHLY